MLSSELDFHLPPELIAQTPHEPRDQSRLLRFARGAALENSISHHRVCDLPLLLSAGDLLVFNNTRVLRARLLGNRKSGGRIEALLLREHERNIWRALLKPSARLRLGEQVMFSDGKSAPIAATLLKRIESEWVLRFEPPDGKSLREFLPDLGEIPVPPYIKTAPREEQYQTVYAQNGAAKNLVENKNCDDGESDEARSGVLPAGVLDSCAAPTAGLHFSDSLFAELKKRGVQTQFLTLGVGVGTFRPIQTATLEEHAMHEEEFFVSSETARAINAQKESGGRVVAVGTTTLRVLESVCDERGMMRVENDENISGKTAIFIKPGFRFRCADALMTNFHLPRSTLLALVAAFIEDGARNSTNQLTGLESVRYAYAQAIAERYRFFSFGDAMLLE